MIQVTGNLVATDWSTDNWLALGGDKLVILKSFNQYPFLFTNYTSSDQSVSRPNRSAFVYDTVTKALVEKQGPVKFTLSSTTLSESLSTRIVGDFTIVDSQTLADYQPSNFIITGGDNKFEIVKAGAVLKLKLKDTATIDYETKNSYSITVKLTDTQLSSIDLTNSYTISILIDSFNKVSKNSIIKFDSENSTLSISSLLLCFLIDNI